MIYRKVRVILTIDTSAPDDRNLSLAVAEALDRLQLDKSFRGAVGESGQVRGFVVGQLGMQTDVRIRHDWRNTICGLPDWLFDRLPYRMQEGLLRKAGMT